MLPDAWHDVTDTWVVVLVVLGLVCFRLAHVLPSRLPIALPKWLHQRPASEGCIMAVLGSGELQRRTPPWLIGRAVDSSLAGGVAVEFEEWSSCVQWSPQAGTRLRCCP